MKSHLIAANFMAVLNIFVTDSPINLWAVSNMSEDSDRL
jgi:hypothetical protein